jgi:putative ABC transport system ATP-binding protein
MNNSTAAAENTTPATDPAPVTDPASATGTAPAAGPDPVVVARDLWKLHKVGDEVVRALVAADLEVRPSEFVCLMGPSGSGKSTLLNLIGGLDRPTRGVLTVVGKDTTALTESQFAALRHDLIGFIFQSYNLIPFLTAVENVELPLIFEPYDRRSLRQRALDLLDLVGLAHRSHHRPSRMSGGEQQRTAIARALISNPRLILADEPTANLDQKTGASVVQLLRRLCEQLDVTVVASTHDPTVAEEATRIVQMRDGRILPPDRSTPASQPAAPSLSAPLPED